MKVVFTHGGPNTLNQKASAWIEVKQAETKQALLTVTYGLEVKSDLTYGEAATSLGRALFNHLACEGVLNNEGAMKVVFAYGGPNTLNPSASAWIEVKQAETKQALLTVTYGLKVKSDLTYSQAATSLGRVIFHHLACEGILNNEGA